jgi:thioredoxin-related protein
MNSRSILAVAGALCLAISTGRAQLNWLTDYNSALKQARDEGKLVLINFTGSDWCGWCIKLKAEVFDRPEFAAFANANLVLLEIDFPRRKAQTEQQRINNSILQNKYRVEGYPTLVVAGDNGRPMHMLGYVPGGPRPFIAEVKKTPGVVWKAAGAVPPPAGSQSPPPSPEQLWAGIAAAPKRYDDLKLTGLSGPATRRFAMINNQTFMTGETARVKLKDGEVGVLCKEIRAKSVLVQMDGATEAKELFLNTN